MRMDQPRASVPVYGGGAARATGLAGQTVCFTGALTCHHDGELMTRQKANRPSNRRRADGVTPSH